jgi:lipopolysaccharide transport system ATP-binding protein
MPVIKVVNLSKKYSISHLQQERYTALRDVITNSTKKIGKRILRSFSNLNYKLTNSATIEDFWALRDVSFEINRGDRVGIIGRNGAGKSTLLKILSRITDPTSGRIEITGRVASLLEVGTGFHPELTGRENIFLNGVILGMTKAEIKRKFAEIVDFAEIEKFLDTPVKRYSSGMYVRLAFAVAAYLEPEILIVDEVLAVGDTQFQKKCLGKMEEVGREGRTVLFVSHNMASLSKLCTRGIVLESGHVKTDSPVGDAIKLYLADNEGDSNKMIVLSCSDVKPQFRTIRLREDRCAYGESIAIDCEIVSPFDAEAGIEIEIHDEGGMPIIYTSTAPMAGTLLKVKAGEITRATLVLGPLNLATGSYYLYFWLLKPWAENYHIVKQPLKFSVEFSDPCGAGFDFRQSYGRGATTIPIVIFRRDSEV